MGWWKIFFGVWLALGAFVAGSIVWLTTVRPETADRWLDRVEADMSQPPYLIAVIILAFAYLLVLLHAYRRSQFSYDDAQAWSLSVDIGCMASAHDGGKMTRYIRDMCRFVNLSTTQARVADIAMTIPYLDKSKRPVTLSATRRLPIDDVRIGPVLPDRYDPFLSFPIRIEPNAVVEGRIEFEVQEGGVDSDDLDLLLGRAKITETRSHQWREVREGEVYDALKRRSYRGRIGAPHPVWGPGLKRLWRRLRGQPIFRMGTPGQMMEEATQRLAEVEKLLAAGKLPPWHEGRTQFTIREAGCIAAEVLPLRFADSPKAQSVASQLIYFATTGAMPIATESQGQRSARKAAINMGGIQVPPVTLDTFITPEAFEHYRDRALRLWMRMQDPARTN